MSFVYKVLVLWNGKPDGWKELGWSSIAGDLFLKTSADLIGLVGEINRVIDEENDGPLAGVTLDCCSGFRWRLCTTYFKISATIGKMISPTCFLPPPKILLKAAENPALKEKAIKGLAGLSRKNKDIFNRF